MGTQPVMRRTLDICAVAMILGYIWLATRTQAGAADPVWRRTQERGTLVVGTDAGFAPFVLTGPDGALTGYDVELLTEIARRLDLRVEWRQVGYDALFSAIDPNNPNQVDALAAGIVLNPGEGWRARFSTPYFDAGQQFVVPLSSTIGGIAEPGDKLVAVQLGSPGETEIRRYASADPTISITNTAQTQAAALEQVLHGQADAAVVDNATALPFIHRGLLRSAGGLTYEPYVIAVPVAAYQLHSEINRIIADLQAEGWIAALNQRWFP